jgi:hypothetical protein
MQACMQVLGGVFAWQSDHQSKRFWSRQDVAKRKPF